MSIELDCLASETFRLNLKERHEVYWAYVYEGVYLGYRKGARKNSWVGRIKMPYLKKYYKKTFGEADCHERENGVTVLSFEQANKLAIDWGSRTKAPRHYRKKIYEKAQA